MTLREKKGYWKLEEEEALDRTVGRTRFGRGYCPLVKQTKIERIIYIYVYVYVHIYISILKR